MNLIRKSIAAGLIILASGAVGLLSPQLALADVPASQMTSVELVSKGSCAASDSLGDIADAFISKCRKGSIRREFPGELLQSSLGDIKNGGSAVHKKAWKLLNDSRFKK
ncbi:hypothetical protein [Nocardia sp. NPDC049707]|uniref:hypothetical protein n=1 Tax=Nocardia sp. NPDC049707 TaxID=3154735 RepID=UPI003432B6D3